MPYTNFDKFYNNFPNLTREKDFLDFWKDSFVDLKMIPINLKSEKNKKKSTHKFTVLDITFNGFDKSLTYGQLLIPKQNAKPFVIIHIGDYNVPIKINQNELDTKVAHFFLQLRGHNLLIEKKSKEEKEEKSPGFFRDNLLSINNYYLKGIYLDSLRSINVLRLIPEINCGSIGIIGKGIGAASAIFTSAFSERVTAISLLTPTFLHLDLSQNISKSYATKEINDFIIENKAKKKNIKRNLTYFDSLNFSDMINCKVRLTAELKNTFSPSECIMAFFHKLNCDKTIEIFAEEIGETEKKEKRTVAENWLVENLTTTD